MSDLNEIQQVIFELSEKLDTIRRARKHLDWARIELSAQEDELHVLYNILKKEEADVNKLKSMSVTSMFRYFLKNIDDQLEIEQQEYVVAALKYNECLDSISGLEYEIGILEAHTSRQDEIEERYKIALIKKELAVKETYPHVATELNNLDYKITRKRIMLKEINEALNAGIAADAKLLLIQQLMAKVEGWGQWGGNYVSHYAKRTFVDKARRYAVEAKLVLNRFERELKDVFRDLNVKDDLTLDAFDQFLSIFYDNMITDWIVRSNLQHTRNSLEGTRAKIQRLNASLRHDKDRVQTAIGDFQQLKHNLIITQT